MSVKSELRAERLEYDRHQCRWPSPWHEGPLQMAHLHQSSQGGVDTIANVVMLCRWHHDILDNRLVKGRREETLFLLAAFLSETESWSTLDG